MVPSEKNTLGSLVENGVSIDWGVLLVEFVVGADLSFSISYNLENVRLTIVISISTNSKVDFLGEGVSLVSSLEGKNWISWGHGDRAEFVVAVGGSLLRVELCVESVKSIHLKIWLV